MYQLTLTPNRANPRRFVNLVIYRREGAKVTPIRVRIDDAGRWTVDEIKYRSIQPSQPEPELQADWEAHVRYQMQLAREEVPPADISSSDVLRVPMGAMNLIR